MRRPLFVANWKMHKTGAEARSYVKELAACLPRIEDTGVVLSPPYTALAAVAEALKETGLGGRVELAAQNIYPEPQGPYTGEVSISMASEHGCRYVIVGHSERRIHFGEDDRLIARKVKALLSGGLVPILCLGERLEERESGRTETVVLNQLDAAFGDSLQRADMEGVILAYEPVWAIGTGRNAEPADAAAVHREIRSRLQRRYGERSASRIRILYGGSVTPANIGAFMREPEIDGALVGGASLSAERFAEIIQNGKRSPPGI
jgi:triosephosphate isomerase